MDDPGIEKERDWRSIRWDREVADIGGTSPVNERSLLSSRGGSGDGGRPGACATVVLRLNASTLDAQRLPIGIVV